MTPAEARCEAVLADAVAHARAHVEDGGLPFVGVVVTADGVVSAYGVNEVRETAEPTAHAEIVAMRGVVTRRGRDALVDSILLATGEPCSLCYRFAADSGVHRVIYAVDQDTAADWGFDYRGGRSAHAAGAANLVRGAERLSVEGALGPFAAYRRLRALPSPLASTHD